MPGIDETNIPAIWKDDIYQIETSDPVLGGPEGVVNEPHKNLAQRTKYLKAQIESIINDYATVVALNAKLDNLPNSKSSDVNSDSSTVLATTALTAALKAQIDNVAAQTDKNIIGLQGYNAATNIMTYNVEGGSTVDIDMSAVIADIASEMVLSDSITSNSSTTGASSKAVKAVNDKFNTYGLGVDAAPNYPHANLDTLPISNLNGLTFQAAGGYTNKPFPQTALITVQSFSDNWGVIIAHSLSSATNVSYKRTWGSSGWVGGWEPYVFGEVSAVYSNETIVKRGLAGAITAAAFKSNRPTKTTSLSESGQMCVRTAANTETEYLSKDKAQEWLGVQRNVLHAQHQEPSNTNYSSINGEKLRPMNTVITNDIVGASVSGGQITLPAGRYKIDFTSMNFSFASNAKAYLKNANSGAILARTNTTINQHSNSDSSATHLRSVSELTLSSTTTLKIMHEANRADSTGLGRAHNNGEVNVYGEIYIEELA